MNTKNVFFLFLDNLLNNSFINYVEYSTAFITFTYTFLIYYYEVGII